MATFRLAPVSWDGDGQIHLVSNSHYERSSLYAECAARIGSNPQYDAPDAVADCLRCVASVTRRIAFHAQGLGRDLVWPRELPNVAIETAGSSFTGRYVRVGDLPFEDLVERLNAIAGPSLGPSDDDKASVYWFGFFRGALFTLYDYQQDKRIHIGGFDDARRMRDEIAAALKTAIELSLIGVQPDRRVRGLIRDAAEAYDYLTETELDG